MSMKSRFWKQALVAGLAIMMTSLVANADSPKEAPGNHRVKPAGYKPIPVSAESQKGKQIFQKNTCVQCHSTGMKGGCLGPVLAGVGARRTEKFIFDRITAGAAEEKAFETLYGQSELMPHPRLPKNQSRLVVSYLMTLPEPKNGFVIKAHVPNSENGVADNEIDKPTLASIQNGKKLFYSKGCMSCHSIGKVGGQFAAALDDVGSRKGRRYISERMTGAELLTLGTNDEYGERGTEMPPSNLTKPQIVSITDFLMSLSKVKTP